MNTLKQLQDKYVEIATNINYMIDDDLIDAAMYEMKSINLKIRNIRSLTN